MTGGGYTQWASGDRADGAPDTAELARTGPGSASVAVSCCRRRLETRSLNTLNA